MARELTITVNDAVYEKLKPLIEQNSLDEFIAKVIVNNPLPASVPHPGIATMRGSLHQVKTTDIREEYDRDL